MLLGFRAFAKVALASAVASAAFAVAGSPAAMAAAPHASSHWSWCNDNAAGSAPKVLWARIQQSASGMKKIPDDFWSNTTYRYDIARIVCYESTFEYHASNGTYWGWFQMSQPLIASEGVTWTRYWQGDVWHHAGWYQCTAGELYIVNRYGNPANAWQHEYDYGWY